MSAKQTPAEIAAKKKAKENQAMVESAWAGRREITSTKLVKISQADYEAYVNHLTWEPEFTHPGDGTELTV